VLHDFIELNRDELVARASGKASSRPYESREPREIEYGVPLFLTQLVETLRGEKTGSPFPPNEIVDHRVDVTLSEAARQADGSVLVEGRWALLGPTGATLVQRRTSHRVHPTAAGAAGAVEGVNQAIAELSREIAGALRSLPPRPGSSDRAEK